MRPVTVFSIIGTRPEAIKLFPVIQELKTRNSHFVSTVCITSQHRQMLEEAIKLFELKVDHNLNIMSHNQTLAQISARAMEGLDRIIASKEPDLVLVQGDTTSALCGALVAYYHKVKIGHIEAGLRTGDKYSPFPEEINRRLIGGLTDFHFAPTSLARESLLRENISPETIFVTGNTVIDTLYWLRNRLKRIDPELPVGLEDAVKRHLTILVTGHRRESFGEGFESICQSIREVTDTYEQVLFVYPVHLNPNVREPVLRILGKHPRILLIDPLPYSAFVWLMDQSDIVLTDSGGVQEEAPSLGKPVLVMRAVTERPEGVDAGNARLVGTDRQRIVAELSRLIESPEERKAMGMINNPYGDGKASKRIVDILEKLLLI
jgi:UDP-N-acetylglucosamine 2-epimerase (non-hydrolysing)